MVLIKYIAVAIANHAITAITRVSQSGRVVGSMRIVVRKTARGISPMSAPNATVRNELLCSREANMSPVPITKGKASMSPAGKAPSFFATSPERTTAVPAARNLAININIICKVSA